MGGGSNEFIRVVEVDPLTETVLGGVTWEELTDNTSDLYTKGQSIKLKNVYDNTTFIDWRSFAVYGSDDQGNPTRVIAPLVAPDIAYSPEHEAIVFGAAIEYVEFYMDGEDLKYALNNEDYLIPVPEGGGSGGSAANVIELPNTFSGQKDDTADIGADLDGEYFDNVIFSYYAAGAFMRAACTGSSVIDEPPGTPIQTIFLTVQGATWTYNPSTGILTV